MLLNGKKREVNVPPKKRKPEEDIRSKILPIRVTENELQAISKKAESHGLNTSTYLRNLGMNYPVKSIVDAKAASSLLKANSDLGRLGGLFKMWMTRNSEDKENFSDQRTYKNIDELVDQIEDLQKLLKSEAMNIMLAKRSK